MTRLEIEEPTAKAPSGINHLLMPDCSTSMRAALPQLREDTIKIVNSLMPDELVSIVIFSGHHTAKVILQPTKCDSVGKAKAAKAIRDYVRPIGTTVFSEPLELALKTVVGLAANTVTSLTLLTDGLPVPESWSVSEEKRRAYADVTRLRDKGVIVNLIGYGVHYDPGFLYDLHENAGFNGMRCHISEIDEWREAVDEIRAMVNRVTLATVYFTFEADSRVLRVFKASPQVSVFESSMIGLNILEAGTTTFWVETERPVKHLSLIGRVNGIPFLASSEIKKMSDDNLRQFRRMAAAWHYIKGEYQSAAALLDENGDTLLADRAANSFTERERRETADLLGRRVYQDKRFIGAGIKPVGPSHCVLNTMRVLIEDPQNVVYIPKGAYKRITERAVDPRIVESPLGRVLQVKRLTSDKESFNFSLLCLVDVKVKPESGDGPLVDAQVWRNYTVIKDGNLHLPELEAAVTEKSFKTLQEAGVINTGEAWESGKTYTINFRGLRMVSPVWANPRNLGLVALMREEADLEVEQTALNARLKALDHTRPEFEGNIYNPTAQKEEGPYEVYMMSCCEYRLMGGYKAPKVDCSGMGKDAAFKRVREVRNRLAVVRYLKRSIVFALEAVGSRVIPWGQYTHTQRGQWLKAEQTAHFDGAELKRVTWEEQVAC